MNSIQLQCFLEAVHCGSFTRAANNLFITQPALSYNISALEKEWGFTLFARGNKKKDMELTRAGQSMYASMSALMQEYDIALHKAKLYSDGKTGELRVGFLNSEILNRETMEAMERFQNDNPAVSFSMNCGGYYKVLKELETGKLDCAIIMETLIKDDDHFEYLPLFTADSLMILNKSHPLATRRNLSFSDFKNETFLNLTQSESVIMHRLLLNGCEKAGFVPRVLDVPDLQTQMLYLEAGKGIMIGSEFNRCISLSSIAGVQVKGLKARSFVLARVKGKANACVERFYQAFTTNQQA